MTISRILALLPALCLLCACEKVDVEATGDDPSIAHERPTSLGEGTQSSPYTVPQVLSGEAATGTTTWVIGYAVGSTYRTMSNALFSAATTYTSNILLSESPSCTTTASCIAIELSSSTIQQSLSLAHNPQGYRQCILVCGQVSRYFSQPGIRNVKSGYWLPNFDPSTLDSSPTTWEEKAQQY